MTSSERLNGAVHAAGCVWGGRPAGGSAVAARETGRGGKIEDRVGRWYFSRAFPL